ncbi:protein phosphatase regulator, partial [Coemansia sp. RSA 2708]
GLEFDGVPDSDILSDDNDSMMSLVDEDVDFGYVYALFNFPQMVEGQVTVEEGEKLTLLDDSNSYWWLVQNLRDNQMGYIPADNIETAFGKLARVNRRKNLKLCKPDPEHMLGREPRAQANARRVAFDDNPVTQVFDMVDSDDDDEDYDDYGAYEAEPAAVPSQDSDDGGGGEEEEEDYSSYYYSADADSGSPETTPTSARRVSIAPMSMGQIDGELHDSDSDDGAYGRREGDATPTYYLSNDESDDGDSLSGVLSRLSDSRDHAPAAGRYTLHVQLLDAFGATEASVALFSDEPLAAVLRRALAVFGMTPGAEADMALYALVGGRALEPLRADAQASALLDRLRAQPGAEPLPAAGAVAASACSLLLAARAVAPAQLLEMLGVAGDGGQEEDPYAAMGAGSHSVLRTSVAASVSEGIASLAAGGDSYGAYGERSSSDSHGAYADHAGSADSDLVPAERGLAPAERDAASLQNSQDADPGAALPDSRAVVQGLLRSIPRPASQPSQSAINRAKRNTVQLSAHGSVVDADFRAGASPPARTTLSRSASTRANGDPAPSEPAQALGLSASTLRPSSDTFNDSAPSSPQARHAPAPAPAAADAPASPTGSSDTASSLHDGSEDAAPPAALTALAHSAPHRLKDAPAELPLDDWLVVLRGWSATHDASASSAFYRSFLQDADPADALLADAHAFIASHAAELAGAQSPVDDILRGSQGVGRRLDTLERELDDIAR